MRVLLDTHTWLWWLTDPERLGPAAHRIIAHSGNDVLFSIASTWEIAIKYSLGKLALPSPPHTLIPSELRKDGFTSLHVEHRHALRVADLEQHHGDPFDRLLIAQAQCERVPILTCDPKFAPYDVDLVWA
jgi:PIN domain nuclease of toxin-antitoxin system